MGRVAIPVLSRCLGGSTVTLLRADELADAESSNCRLAGMVDDALERGTSDTTAEETLTGVGVVGLDSMGGITISEGCDKSLAWENRQLGLLHSDPSGHGKG